MSKYKSNNSKADNHVIATLTEPVSKARLYIPANAVDRIITDAFKQTPVRYLIATKQANVFRCYQTCYDATDKGTDGNSVLIHTLYYGLTDSTGTVNVGSSAKASSPSITPTPITTGMSLGDEVAKIKAQKLDAQTEKACIDAIIKIYGGK